MSEENANTALNKSTDSMAEQALEKTMEHSLDQLSRAFSASARRWETIVYPSLFAFILLAAYGFYLIYNLTADVHRIAGNIDLITKNMVEVSNGMNTVAKNMVLMTQTADEQAISMKDMAVNMHYMNISMGHMRYDLAVMNNSVSRPMQFMNTFMPW